MTPLEGLEPRYPSHSCAPLTSTPHAGRSSLPLSPTGRQRSPALELWPPVQLFSLRLPQLIYSPAPLWVSITSSMKMGV